jgi:hypothetical protein
MSTLTRTLAPLALALGLVAATSAQAQVAGTYVGTTSQGLSISLTLIDDGAGGFIFTGQTTQWNETCKTGDTKFAWWGVGANNALTGNMVSVSYRGNALFEDVSMHFNGTHVTGKFNGGEATYVDVNTSTGKTEACHSGKLTFTADLQPVNGVRAPHASLGAGEARAIQQ